MRIKALAAAATVNLVSLVANYAHAQNVSHALQIGLGTDFLTYTSATATVRVPQGAGGTLEQKSDENTTVWGFGRSNRVALEGGYGLTDSLVIGGVLQMGGWSREESTAPGSNNKTSDSRFSLFIGPKIDYMLLPTSMVRPMFGATLGLIRQTDSIDFTNANATTNQSSFGATGLGVMGRAGIRWFLTPGFSIDPAFVFGVATMSGSYEQPGVNPNTRLSYDASLSGYTVGLQVGLSGWVGL